MRHTLVATLALAGVLTLGACSETQVEPLAPEMSRTLEAPDNRSLFAAPMKGMDPIATIASEAGFNQLVSALGYVDANEGTELVKLFAEGTDQYTVFAPTDDAFGDLLTLLNDGLGFSFGSLTEIPSELVLDVLLYHVVEGRRAANSVVPRNGQRTMTPLLGENFYVGRDYEISDGLTGTGLRDNASIVAEEGFFNISASNGIIHVIDQVIVPPSVVATLLELANGS